MKQVTVYGEHIVSAAVGITEYVLLHQGVMIILNRFMHIDYYFTAQ